MINIDSILQQNNIPYHKHVSLKTKTWIKRGGETRYWVQPATKEQLILVVEILNQTSIVYEVVGSTSNCFFTEEYNPEVTISTTKINTVIFGEEEIECDCGYNMIRLSKYCIKHGISGYEGFIGLPGTVGGAVINNSGAYNSEISRLVRKIELITPDNKIIYLNREQMNYSYRNSSLKSKLILGVVLSVVLDACQREDSQKLKNKAHEFIQHRKKYQENKYPNLGSIHSELKLWENKWSFKSLLFKILSRILKFLPCIPGNKLIFYLHGHPGLSKFVSEKSINCFIWKDPSTSENDFFMYLDFFKKHSKSAILEIQIKK